MKKSSNAAEAERFTKALSSVLSVSPEQLRAIRAQAKDEKPLPHAKYSYAPEEDEN